MLNCILIENDTSTAEKMSEYLGNIPFLSLTACCTNAIEAMKVIRNSHIDIAFINIRLPEMSGVEFAKMLPETLKVIFLVDNKEHYVILILYGSDGAGSYVASFIFKDTKYIKLVVESIC